MQPTNRKSSLSGRCRAHAGTNTDDTSVQPRHCRPRHRRQPLRAGWRVRTRRADQRGRPGGQRRRRHDQAPGGKRRHQRQGRQHHAAVRAGRRHRAARAGGRPGCAEIVRRRALPEGEHRGGACTGPPAGGERGVLPHRGGRARPRQRLARAHRRVGQRPRSLSLYRHVQAARQEPPAGTHRAHPGRRRRRPARARPGRGDRRRRALRPGAGQPAAEHLQPRVHRGAGAGLRRLAGQGQLQRARRRRDGASSASARCWR